MSADDPTPGELAAWRRALAALPPAERAMVQRLARVLQLAAALPAPRTGRTRIKPVDGPDGKLLDAGNDNACDDGKLIDGEALDGDGDELSRELARRILRRHRGRSSGGAA